VDKLDKADEADEVEEITKMVDAAEKCSTIEEDQSSAMGGHVFELPKEPNDQTQYSKTIDKLKEHIKTAYKETYLGIESLFNVPVTQPMAR